MYIAIAPTVDFLVNKNKPPLVNLVMGFHSFLLNLIKSVPLRTNLNSGFCLFFVVILVFSLDFLSFWFHWIIVIWLVFVFCSVLFILDGK